MNFKSPLTYVLVFAVVFGISFLYLKSQQEGVKVEVENFETFYERFMTDSIFQKDRINFPLQGWSASVDSLTLAEGFFWKESEWIAHQKVGEESGFKRDLMLSDVLVKETFYMNIGASNIGYERRFVANEKGKWYLIFYAEGITINKDNLRAG